VRIATAGDQLLHRNIARRGGVLRQQADASCDLFTVEALDLLAIKVDMPLGGRHQAAQGTQQGRFAAAVGANDGSKVTIGNGHGEIIRHHFFTVAER